MKWFVILLAVCCSLLSAQAFAQEICNNNLDDDGDGRVDCLDGDCGSKVCEICDDGLDNDADGFIDCFDKECLLSDVCDGFFLGKDAACEVKPDSFPPFQMRLKYKSEPRRSNHIARLIAGDVDNDGVPELVTAYSIAAGNGGSPTASAISIFQAPASGGTLINDASINLLADGLTAGYEDISMADINKDGCAEIFVITKNLSNNSNFQIHAYNCNGAKVWTAPINLPMDPGAVGLADFDGDGLVELYTRTQIYDAHTGKKLGENNIDNNNTGIHAGVNKGWSMNSMAPIAVDIDATTPGLELVAGCRIYAVSINRGAMTATLTLTKERPEYATRTGTVKGSGTSVADFNQDGFLDVLAVGSRGAYDANTTIFFWDVQNNVLKTYTDLTGTGDYLNGWKNGAGRINIADIDGDTLMNAVYVSGRYLYALKEGATSLELLWRQNVTEETSGITGCTMFDFNADGKSEIVYRDEDYIYIYTTEPDGTVIRSTPVRCSSRTLNEYPIVLDMDADGASEICIICSTTNTTNGRNLQLYDEAEVRVYESSNEPWVPARRVWNQHGYFVANVNDDLSIPIKQQLHHLIYAKNAQCRKFGSSRPLNSFLNQAPYLNSFGCPSYPAPNLTAVPYSDTESIHLDVTPVCPENNFNVTFKFANLGDIAISGTLPVTLYNGDPRLGAAFSTRLNTTSVTIAEMLPGDTTTVTVPVIGPGSSFTLFIVINDNGTTMPLDINAQNNNIRECDYDNVISGDINPLPATLTTVGLGNVLCVGIGVGAPPANGVVKAYVSSGASLDSTNFNFYWSDGTAAKPVASADYVGPFYNNLPAGSYTVFGVHKTAACGSDTVTVTINDEPRQPDIVAAITKIRDNESCASPTGELSVTINGGAPLTDFDIVWYVGNNSFVDTVAIGPIATNLPAEAYTVFVIEKTSNCVTSASESIIDELPIINLTATPNELDCNAAADAGQVEATATSSSGATVDFLWFDGAFVKPVADEITANATNATRLNLNVGQYTVFARDVNSQCTSDTVTVFINEKAAPQIISIDKTDQLSCVSNTGEATVNINGAVGDFDIQWFSGANTLTPIAGAVNPNIENLAAGIYTVEVTHKISGCSATAQVTIDGPLSASITSVTKADQTTCVPANGEIEVESVSPGAISDYVFEWYLGTTISAVNRIPGQADNILENAVPGAIYTVRAIHITNGCITPARQESVTSVVTPFTFSAPVTEKPSDCQIESGEINISITTANTNGYTFEWFLGGAAVGTAISNKPITNTANSSEIINLRQGTYTVSVTDNDTGCKQQQSVFLGMIDSQILSYVSESEVNTCNLPSTNEQIVGQLINPDPGVFNNTDFDIVWYNGSVDPEMFSPPLTVPANPTNFIGGDQYEGVVTFTDPSVPQYYTMVAIGKIGSLTGCRSAVTFEIKQNVVYPTIDAAATAATLTQNQNCLAADPAILGSGSITLNIGAGVETDYNYTWTKVGTPAFTAPNTRTLTNLDPGVYRVVVTDNGGANEGCATTNEFTVLDDPQIIMASETNGDFSIFAVAQCGPDGITPVTNGGFAFNQILVDNTPVNPTFLGFTFTWHRAADGSLVNDNDAVNGDIGGLSPDTYYVVATNTFNCNLTQEFTIENETINTAAVDLINFVIPTQCLQPLDVVGQLEVEASSINPAHSFTFSWFDGNSPAAPPLGTTITNAATTSVAETPDAGFYTVVARNNVTGCIDFQTYEQSQTKIQLNLAASGSPLTYCAVDNGEAFVRITNTYDAEPDPNFEIMVLYPADRYSFEWVNTAAATTIVGDNPFVSTLADGTYAVTVTEIADPGCEATASVVIDKIQIFPVVTTTAISPNQICNVVDNIPNGVASASVDGNIIDYEFTWYDASVTTSFATGPLVGNLLQNTYQVIGANRVTGCSDTTSVTIGFVPLPGLLPTIEIISQVTSCVEDNGALAVSVDGNTQDYNFYWYDDQPADPTDPDAPGNNVSNTGEFYTELMADHPYYVIAEDRFSGCISPVVSETLQRDTLNPQFKIDLLPASCEEDNGEIYLTVTNDVEIAEIIWTSTATGTILGDPVLQGIPAGTYNVRVVTQLGCFADKTVVLQSDIRPFNGISRNNDGKNEIFWINCIGDFPDNIVRIYNRAGSLVYEDKGYDNIDIYFDGKSNRGVNPMGNNLPDGTYFYVIDKRDGSKPIAGYLEIVN